MIRWIKKLAKIVPPKRKTFKFGRFFGCLFLLDPPFEALQAAWVKNPVTFESLAAIDQTGPAQDLDQMQITVFDIHLKQGQMIKVNQGDLIKFVVPEDQFWSHWDDDHTGCFASYHDPIIAEGPQKDPQHSTTIYHYITYITI